MRNIVKVIAIIFVLGMFAAPSESLAGVHVYLRFGPPPPVRTVTVVRPAKPYRHAVWVAGHWKYDCGRYIWVDGHWIKARRHYVYVQPHWVRTPRGFYFVPGHWVRK
jgi:hypothetical protein